MNGYGGTVGTVGGNNVGNGGTDGTVTYSTLKGVTAANGRRDGTLESFPFSSNGSKVVPMTVVTNAREVLGVASLRWRAGRLERMVWSKNILRRNVGNEVVATTDWPSSSFCDLVPTSEPFKPSFVLEPDILLEPDSVLDIFCDTEK